MTTREEFIDALRQLADFLTANPDAPVPPYGHDIQVSATGYYTTEQEQIEFIRQAALGMGVEPAWNERGTHFEASLQFGPIRYFAVASTAEHQADFAEQWRLAKEAFAAAKAEREANTLDGEAVEYLPAPFVKATPAELAEAYESSAQLMERLHSDEPVTIHTKDLFDGHDGEIVQPDLEGGYEVAVDGGVYHFEPSEVTRRTVAAGGTS